MSIGSSAKSRWSGFANALSKVGGLVLVAIGIMMLSGNMNLLVVWGFQLFDPFYTALLKYM